MGEPTRSRWWLEIALMAGLVVLTYLIYRPVTDFSFLIFDDDLYVTGNLAVQRGLGIQSVADALGETVAANWHPVTMLSHRLDVTLFGMDPGKHHLVNVILHLINLILLMTLFRLGTGKILPALVFGSLFALHPLRVESVAWISERKDVLSTMFWLAGIGLYGSWARRKSWWKYLLLTLVLTMGLLSKAMLVTFPFALLVLDIWPLGRLGFPKRPRDGIFWKKLRSLIWEKLPWFVLTTVFCVVAIRTQSSAGAVSGFDALPLLVRCQTAIVAYTGYLGKFIWPADLACVYPHPGSWSGWVVAGSLGILAVISSMVILIRNSRPWWLCGWLWYLGTLVPVIGLVQIGDQWMADRYTYVPLLGIAGAIAWEIHLLVAAGHRMAGLAAIAASVALALLTSSQLKTWKDTETLSLHAIRTTGGNSAMRTNLAISLAGKGDFPAALEEFQQVARDQPNDPEAVNNVARVLEQMGRLDEAGGYYLTALRLDPDYSIAHQNLGRIYASKGRDDLAVPHFEALIRLRPDDPMGFMQLARVLAISGVPGLQDGKRAVELATRGCALEPQPSISSREILAASYAADGKTGESIAALSAAAEIARKSGQRDQENRLNAMIGQLRKTIR